MTDRQWRQFRERAEHLVTVPDLDQLQRRGIRLRRIRIAAGAAAVAAAAAIGATVATTSVTDHDTAPRPVDRNDQNVPPSPAGPGLFTLPPVGAAPSTPEHGELVVGWPDGPTFLYADGRLIWSRPFSGTGWVEQRLTPEGVELVRTEILSTGLFDPESVGWPEEVRVRDGGQLLELPTRLTGPESGESVRLHWRLGHLQAWLPDNAWKDRELKPYVPSRYAIVLTDDLGLPLLPVSVQELIAAARPCRLSQQMGIGLDSDTPCFEVTTEEAREAAEALDDAGIKRLDTESLVYYFKAPDPASQKVAIGFAPRLPHDAVGVWGG